MLVEFAKNKFRIFFEVALWLNLIGCAINGAVIGYYKFGGYNGSLGYGFIGFILGILVGLISTVIFGGLVAIFLNIDANVEIIKDNSFGTETSEAKVSKTEVSLSDPLNLLSNKNTRVTNDPLNLL